MSNLTATNQTTTLMANILAITSTTSSSSSSGSSTGSLPTTTSTASDTATTGTNCVTCSDATPVCDCQSGESCVLTSRTCTSCPAIQCIASTSSGSSSSSGNGSSNLGAIVGPVVAAVVLVGLTVAGWWWWKRRKARDLRLLGFSSSASAKHYANSKHSDSHSPQPQTFRLPSASAATSPRQANSVVSGVPTDVNAFGDKFGETYSFKAKAYAVDGTGGGGGGDGRGDGPGGGQGGFTRKVYLGNGNINLDTYSDTGRGGDGDEGSEGMSGHHDGNGQRPSQRFSRQASGNPFDDSRSAATSGGMSFGSTNVIPITYVPSPPGADGLGFSDEGGPEDDARGYFGAAAEQARDPAAALEEARRAAFGGAGGQAPMVDRAGRPIRPARDPGLDLRLRSGAGGGMNAGGPSAFLAHLDKMSRDQEASDQEQMESVRNSTYTGKSVAPSFFSGTSEAPMIMTSRQVQVGMRQAAEVINLADAGRGMHQAQQSGQGRNLTIDTALTERAKQHQVARSKVVLTPTQDAPEFRPGSAASGLSGESGMSNPFEDRHGTASDVTPRAVNTVYPPSKSGSNDLNRLRAIVAPPMAGTFGSIPRNEAAAQASFRTGQATKAESTNGSIQASRRFPPDLPGASWNGSEAGVDSSVNQRDSFSSIGTGSVVLGEARKVQLGPSPSSAEWRRMDPPPESEYLKASQNSSSRAPVAFRDSGSSSGDNHGGPRESIISTKSFADSLLGSFPMILPTEEERNMMAYASHQRLPTSTSNNTISSNMAPRVAAPISSLAVSDSPLKKVNSAPVTAVPFTGVSAFPRTAIQPPTVAVPPSKGAATNSFEGNPLEDLPRPGRNTAGMSMASQGSGLGGFEFKFS